MTVAYNYSSTAVETTITGSIDSADTTINVGSTTGFPAAPFKVTIGPDTGSEEVVKVTGVAGLALTVVRGHDGSVAVAHSAGDEVKHQATAEDLRLSRQHEDAVANIHGIGATSNVVGTKTVQTLEGKTIDDALNTLLVDQASVTGLVTALADINTNIDDWDADTAPIATQSATPSTYPSGFSIRRILASGGWPVDGFVFTYKFSDNTRASQFFGEAGAGTNSVAYYRHYNGTAWQAHRELTNSFGTNWATALAATLAGDWANILDSPINGGWLNPFATDPATLNPFADGLNVAPRSLFARKTSTETVVSSTLLQDDNDLTLPVVANGVYRAEIFLKYDSSATSDLKIQFVGPAGASFQWTTIGLIAAATSQQDIQMVPGTGLGAPEQLGVAAGGATTYATILGLLDIAGTGGTFKLQWAQQVSGGTNTNMFAGSYMLLQRVA